MVFSAQTPLHCHECDTVVGLACSHTMKTAKVSFLLLFLLIAFIWAESSACSPMGRFQLRWVLWAWNWFHFCSVPMQQQLKSSLLSQGLPAIPCARPEQLLWSPGMHKALVSQTSMGSAQPLPCLQGGTAQLLSQQPRVSAGAGRSSLAHSSLVPGMCSAALSVPEPKCGSAPEPRQPGRSTGGHTGLCQRRAGTTHLQVGQGASRATHPVASRSPTVPKLWQGLLPLPVPCCYGLGQLQEEQSFAVSLRSPESQGTDNSLGWLELDRDLKVNGCNSLALSFTLGFLPQQESELFYRKHPGQEASLQVTSFTVTILVFFLRKSLT